MAAHRLHAQVDGRAHTAPARQAFLDRFGREVDPDGVLPSAERAKRAEHAKKAYMLQLSLRSADARRRRAQRGVNGNSDDLAVATETTLQRKGAARAAQAS
jgi:hypothetical protein